MSVLMTIMGVIIMITTILIKTFVQDLEDFYTAHCGDITGYISALHVANFLAGPAALPHGASDAHAPQRLQRCGVDWLGLLGHGCLPRSLSPSCEELLKEARRDQLAAHAAQEAAPHDWPPTRPRRQRGAPAAGCGRRLRYEAVPAGRPSSG